MIAVTHRSSAPAQKNYRFFGAFVLTILLAGLAACDDHNSNDARQNSRASVEGIVQSGGIGLAGYRVSLYRTTDGLPQMVASTDTFSNGRFQIDYEMASDISQSVYYLIAEDPMNGAASRFAISMAAALGTAPEDESAVVINERTTVATAYAMAQFIHDDGVLAGVYPGLQNAADTVRNLANLQTGEIGDLLGREPNGLATSTMRTFNSLANMLAACVNEQIFCETLFNNARSLKGLPPENTLEAMRNVAKNPWQNVDALYVLSLESDSYVPRLDDLIPPTAWTLALRYIGDGPEGQKMDGPGNVAFDVEGNAWIANNYEYSLNPSELNICGGRQVMKLTPTGGSPPGAPYGDAGLYGAGFGVTMDIQGNAWVGSFGFQGASCTNDFLALSQSLAKFGPDGEPLSNSETGIFVEGLSMPQGMASDENGNLWVAGCTSNNVLKLPGGDAVNAENYDELGLQKPFDIAIDHQGHVWVSSNETGTVVEIDNDGNRVGEAITGPGFVRPMGVATDSEGNVWVSESGVLDPPCPTPSPNDILIAAVGENGELNVAAAVTLIQPDGEERTVTTFGRTLDGPVRRGLRLPWGIAIDGNDNVYVANFAGQRLMILCGVKEEFCPPNTGTGDAWGSENGYPSDALTRNTGVQIDPSGNVWLANNWIIDAFDNVNEDTSNQNNPGGHSMVVYIGLAAPVKTPLIGPPRRP